MYRSRGFGAHVSGRTYPRVRVDTYTPLSHAIYTQRPSHSVIHRRRGFRSLVDRSTEVTADIMSFEIPEPYVWDESFRVMVSIVDLVSMHSLIFVVSYNHM